MSADSSSIGANHPPSPRPRRHPPLDALADRPVLAVDEVPQLGGVGRIEAGRRDLVGMEEEVADDGRAGRSVRPQGRRGDVLGGEAQQQVGVDELALVPRALGVVEVGERCPRRRAGGGERPRPVAVRDARFPLQPAAATAEGGDQLAQLRVDGTAVVALVVVLGEHLPVGGDVVGERDAAAELGQRVAPHPLDDRARAGSPAAGRRRGRGGRTGTRPTRRPRPDAARCRRRRSSSAGRNGRRRSPPSRPYVHWWYGQRMTGPR